MGGSLTPTLNVGNNMSSSGARVGGDISYGGSGGSGRAIWGRITGDIEHQEDLQIELHKRDTEVATQAEIEAILYLD